MAEWQQSMSAHEFGEWMAYFRLQPFGEWRKDYRFAAMTAVLVNALTRSKESDPIRKAEDFMPDFERALDEYQAQEDVPEEERTWQKIKSTFGALSAMTTKRKP